LKKLKGQSMMGGLTSRKRVRLGPKSKKKKGTPGREELLGTPKPFNAH